MSKAVIIPWSGGMDSTTLLIDQLIHKRCDHVYTMYIEIPGPKTDCELLTTDRIKAMLSDDTWWKPHSKVSWDHEVYKFRDYPPLNNGEGIFQPPVWLLYMAFYAGHIATKHDEVEVQIGYVRGDDALRYEDRVIELWDSIQSLTRIDKTPFHLTFPFRGMTKRHIHERLQRYERDMDIPIVAAPWVCESPEVMSGGDATGHRRCGECTPCKRDPRY